MWTYNKIIIYFCLIITGKLINWNQIKVMVNLIINCEFKNFKQKYYLLINELSIFNYFCHFFTF